MSITTSRTVRFTKEELKAIEQFLEQNPFFDFSTLTRVAIKAFLEDPKLPLRAVKNSKPVKNREKEATL